MEKTSRNSPYYPTPREKWLLYGLTLIVVVGLVAIGAIWPNLNWKADLLFIAIATVNAAVLVGRRRNMIATPSSSSAQEGPTNEAQLDTAADSHPPTFASDDTQPIPIVPPGIAMEDTNSDIGHAANFGATSQELQVLIEIRDEMRRRNNADSADSPDTNIAREDRPSHVTVTQLTTKPKSRGRRYIETGNDDLDYLVIERVEAVKKNRRREWRLIEQRILLTDSTIVDHDICRRIKFEFTDEETRVDCFQRLHFWSHGPAQILIGIVTIGLVVTCLHFDVSLFISLAILLMGIIAYLMVWIPWAYTYHVLTDKRFGEFYSPPWIIPGHTQQSLLSRLQDILQNETWLGNILGYGTISSETTSSEKDEWIRNGIKFVRHHKLVHQALQANQMANE